MSDDGARGCKADESTATPALYTLLPVQSKNAPLRGARSKGCGVNLKLNFRQHRRDRINRDISHLRSEKCSEDFGQPSSNSFIHLSSLKCRTSYRLLNVCLILMLNVICNQFVTYVNCDELYNSVGARAHFTHTWALHIPGGEQVAEQVAADHGMHLRGKILDDHYHFEHKSIAKRSIEASHPHQRKLDKDERVVWSKQQRAKSRQKRDFTRLKPQKTFTALLNDQRWTLMWYLNRGGGYDMNVIPAWREGITGKGVVVTILDDGLETDHPDLERNYDPEASYDVNSHDADPMPHYDLTDSNRHGTRCAGEVAATANNSLCSVGIAFNARVGGVRMLDGDVTDAVEAQSLGLKPQHIDIYSASWGPDDDGKTVDGPGEMATKAFIDGVTKGRGGKGSIFIWASGNGGREHDNCNCDGYTNSIWTLSISSATENGDIPWYSEKCSSTLATTYSSGQQNEKQVITTDLHHMCTSSHTGTSASAPLAAGIAALVLEANPSLTWRDLQHIVVRTANPAYLGKSPSEWSVNGVGRKVSHSFGYGLMDAAAMVRLARVWETIPEQQRCEIHSPHLDKAIPPRRNVTFTLKVDHCKGVNFLEHVQARISLTTQRRGDIMIFLTSPSGTRTCLLTERVHDVSRSGFNDWPFMTVHQWGESPQGVWQLEINNKGRFMEFAMIRGWTLVLYGTVEPPQHDDEPRPSVPPSLLYANINNNYSLNTFSRSSTNNYGTTNPYTNRSQQQSQQKSTTVAVQTNARKNGKQKNNGKGNKNNNQRMSTTPKPFNTTAVLNPLSNNAKSTKNKSKFSQNASNASLARITSTLRPRTTTPRVPNSKSFGNGGKNFNLLTSKMEKLTPEDSNIFEKAPGKAPKQVKEGSFSTSSYHDLRPTPNPSMTKMFERYEKIEQIYPELKPYKDNHNPAYFTVTNGNGKPSRENSKSFSSFVSLNSVPQKKNSPSDVSTVARQQVLSQSANEKSGKGQITQWNLMFYGTNDPPQKTDPPRLSMKKTVNDLVHNSVESSQWNFISKDDTESDIHSDDNQRSVDGGHLKSSACLRYSETDRKYCLECERQAFTYEGGCFFTCPDRTFIVPEKVSAGGGSLDSKGLSLKRREANIDEYRSLQDIIGRTESFVKNRATLTGTGHNQKLCGRCHESCASCNGPADADCLICERDHNRIVMGSQVVCTRVLINEPTILDNIKTKLSSYSRVEMALIGLAIAALLTALSFVIVLTCRKKEHPMERDKITSGKYSYIPITQDTNEGILLSKLEDIPDGDSYNDESDESDN